jgi:NAD(P)-dependent dehydrogenase (short-subunit alcohol dehydrogenase family)
MGDRLKGKVAVITGAASGIGEGTARIFVAEGANVVIADMQAERGEALAKELGAARFCKTDVTSEDAVEAAIDHAVKAFGRFDCMVNNAGFVGGVGGIAEFKTEHWHATLSVLLDGVFYGVKHAARALLKQGQGGSILSTSSIAGLRGGYGAHAYATCKAAIVGLTRSAASELAANQIRVNAVAPGGVISALTLGLMGEVDMSKLDEMAALHSPMKLPMYPEEIGQAFAYLASDHARQVTGQVLVVDAGALKAPEPAPFHGMEPGFLGPPISPKRG